MVFIKMLQTKTAINASRAMRNDLISFPIKYNAAMSFWFYNSQSRPTYVMFTLYRIVKRSATESVLDRASVHTRNAAFEAVSAPEQYCSAPLLKVGLCSHCTGQ